MINFKKIAIKCRDKLAARLWPEQDLAILLQNPTAQTCLRTLLVVEFLDVQGWKDADAAKWADRVTGCVSGDAVYPAADILKAYPSERRLS